MRFIKNLIIAAASLWMLTGQSSVAQEQYSQQKVVYHISESGGDDGSGYKAALNNMQNQINAVGEDNIDLRVVMHGDGIGLLHTALQNQQLQGLIVGLKNSGVKFLVCNNTLLSRNIDPDEDLFDVWPQDIVPSGVAEIAKLQMEGFAYIKP